MDKNPWKMLGDILLKGLAEGTKKYVEKKTGIHKIVADFVTIHEQKSLEPEYILRLSNQLRDTGFQITDEDLISLIEDSLGELNERKYRDFKSHIASKIPHTTSTISDAKAQILESYHMCFGEDASRFAWLTRLLHDAGFEYVDPARELNMYLQRKMFQLYPNNVDQLPIITMQNIDMMDGLGFETYIGFLFNKMGYSVEFTPKSRDKGGDLIITDAHYRRIVQVKHRAEGSKVGIKAVQELVGALKSYAADEGWLVSNRHYTRDAKKLARDNNVRLIGRDELNLLNFQYGSKRDAINRKNGDSDAKMFVLLEMVQE